MVPHKRCDDCSGEREKVTSHGRELHQHAEWLKGIQTRLIGRPSVTVAAALVVLASMVGYFGKSHFDGVGVQSNLAGQIHQMNNRIAALESAVMGLQATVQAYGLSAQTDRRGKERDRKEEQ